MKNILRKIAMCCLSLFMVLMNINVVNATNDLSGSHNLKQRLLEVVERMPNMPSNYKLINWADRGKKLNEFVFDHTATNFKEKTEFSVKKDRKFSTIYRDDKYGGYMIPAFYGENRPIIDREIDGKIHDGEDDQESISVTSALIAASLLGIDMNKELPEELRGKSSIDDSYEIKTYLDNELKYYWKKDGVITNVPNGSESKLQNTNVSNAYGDFWYLLIANQNFYRLADLNPKWKPEEVKKIQKSIANKMVEMVDVLKQRSKDTGKGLFDIQCFDFENKKAVEPGWRQPDAAAGTANILYYAYKIFKDTTYLDYAKICMDYLQSLESNPYYENMLIDAVYLASMMNAEEGTEYDISKFWNWITTTSRSSVRNWGSVNYSQDGVDVYGMTGEPNNGYSYFFNSIYPLTSILPAAKYDPSYARMAGKWAINIANASRYFLPSEWSDEHQTDGEFKGKLEENILAYESLRKNDKGKHFYATGDAKNNATSGWMAGENTTNFGLYGGFYTGFLGALVEKTNVEGILKLDCNKTDYYQDDMYKTYLYYNPYMESKEVEIDLGNKYYDLYDSVSGVYLAKNVTGKQTFKILADSARVIVLTEPNSKVDYNGYTTTINGKLVAHSKAEVLPPQGSELIKEILIEGADSITQRNQTVQFSTVLKPTDNLLDSRVVWSITDENGRNTDKATITQNGLVTAYKNGKVKVMAKAIDGSGVVGEKIIDISGQTLASLSQNKNVVTSTNQSNNPGSLAVDGDTTTRWVANAAEKNPWIYVDLEKEAKINLIVLNWETARPPKYEIQISKDANNWKKIASIEDEGNSAKVVRIALDKEYDARYVRVYANEKSNYGCSMYEFDVYGSYTISTPVKSIDVTSENNIDKITTKNKPLQMYAKVNPEDATDKRVEWHVTDLDGKDTDIAEINSSGVLTPLKNGVVNVVAKSVDGSGKQGTMTIHLENQDKDNLALNKDVSASAEEGANPKSLAVDGKLNTRWASGDKNQDQWITVDLGDIYNVNKTVMYWESYSKRYKIQGSIDGVDYFDLYEKTDGTGGVEENTFNAKPARYVRVQNIERGTEYGCSLWEFQVYGDKYEKVLVEKIEIKADMNEITQKHKPLQLTADINPKDATVKEVQWFVVDENGKETDIAFITKEGQLTPLSNGKVKVIAKATDGSHVEASKVIIISGQDSKNIALNKDVTALSYATNNVLPKYAVDGKEDTRWAASSTPINKNDCITIDLGDVYIINQVSLLWENSYAKEYKIQGSLNGKDYFDIYHQKEGKGKRENIYFDNQVVRYVRMQGIETSLNYGYSIYEFEIYGKQLKEDLSVVYSTMINLDESLYTPNSYASLKDALDKAKVVLDSDQTTLEEVNNAIDNLNEASKMLVYRADIKKLEKIISDAKKIDENLYTLKSYHKLIDILDKAVNISQNANASQEEVDKIVVELQSAIDNLEKRADKKQLLDLIKKVEKINKDDYTKESIDQLDIILKKANKALDNIDVKQEEVDLLYKQLKEAYEMLEKKKIDVVPEKPSHKPSSRPLENPDVQDKGETSLNIVQTFDENVPLLFILLGVISGLGVYVIYKKLKKENENL